MNKPQYFSGLVTHKSSRSGFAVNGLAFLLVVIQGPSFPPSCGSAFSLRTRYHSRKGGKRGKAVFLNCFV